jgi:hypothetical protein
MHDNAKWHFTYFHGTGDYHLKGNSGTAKAYQKGFFAGIFRTNTFNQHKRASAQVINEGAAEYQFCATQIAPLYATLPNYKGVHL